MEQGDGGQRHRHLPGHQGLPARHARQRLGPHRGHVLGVRAARRRGFRQGALLVGQGRRPRIHQGAGPRGRPTAASPSTPSPPAPSTPASASAPPTSKKPNSPATSRSAGWRPPTKSRPSSPSCPATTPATSPAPPSTSTAAATSTEPRSSWCRRRDRPAPALPPRRMCQSALRRIR